jgi:hypothetical protein
LTRLELAFRAEVVFKWATVAGHDERVLFQEVGAQLKQLLTTSIFRNGYLHILPTPQVLPGTVWQTIRPLTFARGHSCVYLLAATTLLQRNAARTTQYTAMCKY